MDKSRHMSVDCLLVFSVSEMVSKQGTHSTQGRKVLLAAMCNFEIFKNVVGPGSDLCP
jgi:hypothetical protein